MPTHITEIFFYDDIYFENGRKDRNEHPVIIAGDDDENIYCFAMTSRTKHNSKNGYSRNIYNQNIKYVKTIPGRNCQTNNSIEGLINTTNCIIIPKDKAKDYSLFGIASKKLINDIIIRWAFQQHEINDKPDDTYLQKAKALGIDESIIFSSQYQELVRLIEKHPEELENQRTYAKELREYRENCQRIRRENVHNHYLGIEPKKYPAEPKLPDDKAYLELYSAPPPLTEEERIKNSPIAGLSEQLFKTDISEQKAKLIELKNMLQSNNQTQEETQHSKKAA